MSNSIASSVRTKVLQMEPGTLFGYELFNRMEGSEATIAKALSRLSQEGVIRRVKKGKYLKPQKSVFGESNPSEGQLLNMLTEKNGKKTGYLTGTALFNRMGLTSQVPTTLVIATAKPLPPKKLQGYVFKYVQCPALITDRNIPLLQLLDTFRAINSIPGAGVDEVYPQLIAMVQNLPVAERNRLADLALYYNPSTRALVGATLEKYTPDRQKAQKLLDTLNPLSFYQIGIRQELLPNKSKWKIR